MRGFSSKPEDIDLAMAPLSAVGARLRADLAASGQDKACGECGKAFTSSRQVHAVVRHVVASLAGVSMVYYLVCSQCANKSAKRAKDGGCVATDEHRTLSLAMHKPGSDSATEGQS